MQVEIVGVVTDAAHSDLGQRTDPILYRPFDVAFLSDTNRVVLVARTRNDPVGCFARLPVWLEILVRTFTSRTVPLVGPTRDGSGR